jgi:hypothetical protein
MGIAKIVTNKEKTLARRMAKNKLNSIAHAKKLNQFNAYWAKLKPSTITNLKRAGIDKNEAKDRYVMNPGGLGLNVNLWQRADKVMVPKGSGEKLKKSIEANRLGREKTKKAITDTIANVKNIFKKEKKVLPTLKRTPLTQNRLEPKPYRQSITRNKKYKNKILK